MRGCNIPRMDATNLPSIEMGGEAKGRWLAMMIASMLDPMCAWMAAWILRQPASSSGKLPAAITVRPWRLSVS